MHQISSDPEDALALARIHCLLGAPEHGLEMCERVLNHGNRGQVVRAHLLYAEAFSSIENLEAAEDHLNVGLRLVPRRWNYYRARFRIAQSRIALDMGRTDRAAVLIRDPAVERVRSRFNPVQLECLVTESSVAMRRGNHRRARLLAEKARLKSRTTERPGQRAEVLGTLAIAEACTGNVPAAEVRYQRALGILLGFKSLLSPELKTGFDRAHVAPMRDKVRARLQTSRPNNEPPFMVALGRFLDSLNKLPDETAYYSRILDCIRQQFPFSGARLHLANTTGLPGARVASLDSVRDDYRRWLEAAPAEPPIHVESDRRIVSISVALSKGPATRGWLYLERPGRLLPELDFDLLVVLKGILEQLLEKPPQGGSRSGSTSQTAKRADNVTICRQTSCRYRLTGQTRPFLQDTVNHSPGRRKRHRERAPRPDDPRIQRP